MGLALSGGGIRSASFCLGVVQVMAERGLLERVDYLSTVSGGGYLGAAISNLLNGSEKEHAASPESFPLRMAQGGAEPPALRHLRNGSNYLRPGGALDGFMMPAVYARGFLLTITTWMPLVLAGVLITGAFYEIVLPALERAGYPLDGTPTFAPFTLGIALFLAFVAAHPLVSRRVRQLEHRERYERFVAGSLAIAVCWLLAFPLWWLVDAAVSNSWAHADRLVTAFWDRATDRFVAQWRWFVAGGASSALLVALAARNPRTRPFVWRIAILFLGMCGPVALLAMYLGACLYQVGEQVRLDDAGALIAALPHVGQPEAEAPEALLLELERRDLAPDPGLLVRHEGTSAAVGGVATHLWSLHIPGAEDGRTWGTVSARGDTLRIRLVGALLQEGGPALVILVLVCFVLNARWLNVNTISPHGFYRDRLSRVFLTDATGDNAKGDALKLSDLGGGSHEGGSHAPYHLINGTLNLHSSTDSRLRGRKGDFFIFSKHFIGSDTTGWCPTRAAEAVDPHLSLGTAMAISGGVAAPNMGSMTSGSLTFLMTLLNIRMGYWAPNPRFLNRGGTRQRFAIGPGPVYLAREALRDLHADLSYVNVTDGGHLENLGVYELLRRRCRFIVSVDGEEDRDLRMGSLANVIRYARIDLGIDIEVQVDDLRKNEQGLSRAHHIVALVHYAPGEIGVLVYIKATVTGDEGLQLDAYREQNPSFPHESTADQFFEETQLEVYRSLGEHIARGIWPTLDPRAHLPTPT